MPLPAALNIHTILHPNAESSVVRQLRVVRTGTMSVLTDFNGSAPDQEDAVAASAQRRAFAQSSFFFIVAATLSAIRKDVAQCFDEEPTHPMHLQHSGKRWPALEDVRMPGPSGFYFTGEANHLEATGFLQIV